MATFLANRARFYLSANAMLLPVPFWSELSNISEQATSLFPPPSFLFSRAFDNILSVLKSKTRRRRE